MTKRCLSVSNATSGLYVSKEGKSTDVFSVTFTPCLSLNVSKALKDGSSEAGLDKFCCSGPQKPKKNPVHKECNRKVVRIYILKHVQAASQASFLFYHIFLKKQFSSCPTQLMWVDIPPHLSLQLMSLI